MPAVNFFTAFGFYTENSAVKENIPRRVQIELAVLNVAGYIPLIGLAPGILRIMKVVNEGAKFDGAFKVGMVVRAIFEILGVGLVIGLLLDTTVTAVRHSTCCRANSGYLPIV